MSDNWAVVYFTTVRAAAAAARSMIILYITHYIPYRLAKNRKIKFNARSILLYFFFHEKQTPGAADWICRLVRPRAALYRKIMQMRRKYRSPPVYVETRINRVEFEISKQKKSLRVLDISALLIRRRRPRGITVAEHQVERKRGGRVDI